MNSGALLQKKIHNTTKKTYTYIMHIITQTSTQALILYKINNKYFNNNDIAVEFV